MDASSQEPPSLAIETDGVGVLWEGTSVAGMAVDNDRAVGVRIGSSMGVALPMVGGSTACEVDGLLQEVSAAARDSVRSFDTPPRRVWDVASDDNMAPSLSRRVARTSAEGGYAFRN